MAIFRTSLLTALLAASAGAYAHPGHQAAAIHLHESDFAALALAAAVLAAGIAFAIRAIAMHKRKSRP